MTTLLEKLKSNVITYRSALRQGYRPHDYSPHKDNVPTGQYHVILDFMIWSKDLSGIDCYFRVKQTGQKIRLTVRRNGSNYKLGDMNVLHLTISYTWCVYVSIDGNGKPSLDKFGSTTFDADMIH